MHFNDTYLESVNTDSYPTKFIWNLRIYTESYLHCNMLHMYICCYIYIHVYFQVICAISYPVIANKVHVMYCV